MHQGLYDRLVEIAQAGDIAYYEDVAPLVGLDMDRIDHRNEMSELLDEISRFEHDRGRPLLSAVIVRKPQRDGGGGGIPGLGFFKMARSLGVQQEPDVPFFAHELTRVHAHGVPQAAHV